MTLNEEPKYLLRECFWVSLHFISISYNPTLILKRAKKIYGWKAFLCYSLIFLWEKYSEKFLKDNCAPRELNYIFEKFLGRLLSTSNIAFSTWSELRVTAYLTDTKAKTQGQLWICYLVFLGKERFVWAAWTQVSDKFQVVMAGRGKSRGFFIQRWKLQFELCHCPILSFLPLLRPTNSYFVQRENVTFLTAVSCVWKCCADY